MLIFRNAWTTLASLDSKLSPEFANDSRSIADLLDDKIEQVDVYPNVKPFLINAKEFDPSFSVLRTTIERSLRAKHFLTFTEYCVPNNIISPLEPKVHPIVNES
jgi:hypothetical protein